MVRFYVDYRIKPHVPPFVLTPANSVNFEFCNYTHLVDFLVLTFKKSEFRVRITRVSNPVYFPYFNASESKHTRIDIFTIGENG